MSYSGIYYCNLCANPDIQPPPPEGKKKSIFILLYMMQIKSFTVKFQTNVYLNNLDDKALFS